MPVSKRLAVLFCMAGLYSPLLIAQLTTGAMGGMVKSSQGERMWGASVKLQHEPTGTAFFTQSNRQGIFQFSNLLPGGPYTVTVVFLNHATANRKEIIIPLGEELVIDFILEPLRVELQQVTVTTHRKNAAGKTSWHTVIDKEKMDMLPAAGRNLYEYLGTLPQSRLVAGNEGAVSFAGQNNRFNAFYIDGTVNNDVFGLSASGTNGGQTGISPIPADAVEQIHVNSTPYDASLGNFTGAAINAVSRSGSNKAEVSGYHFFSRMASPQPMLTQGESYRKTYGLRVQGPLVRNNSFYFCNIELYKEKYPQPFDLSGYQGDTRDPRVPAILANSLLSNHQYDTGGFLDNPEQLHSARVMARFDWNLNPRQSLTLSMRYMQAERINSNPGNAHTIHFGHDGYVLFHTSYSLSAEWKSSWGKHSANKLLLTYTGVRDDRQPNGKPFPRVRIYDGDGSFVFGTDNSSTINFLQQHNWNINEKFSFMAGRHAIVLGMDGEYNRIHNAFIQHSFGSYTYYSLDDFLRNAQPASYQLGFSLIDTRQDDHINAAAKFAMGRAALFMNDGIKISATFSIQAGLRADTYFFFTTPRENSYVNDTAIPAFRKYYDIQGARSGSIRLLPAFSPRLSLRYQPADRGMELLFGVGIFSGRMPLAWPGGVYQYDGIATGGYAAGDPQLARIRFRADPYHQWLPAEIGATVNNAPLNLVSARLRLPSLFRTSISLEKNFRSGWKLLADMMFSKILVEMDYTNSNLLPPVAQATGPDSRLVYTSVNEARIPLNSDGSNPYDHAILLGNTKEPMGHAWQFNLSLRKLLAEKLVLEMSGSIGNSIVSNDGTSSVNLSQWRTMESVNGRNGLGASVSDFSPGQKFTVWLNKKFSYAHGRMGTSISLLYTGQSGTPFSFVYGGYSMVRDDGRAGGYELLYIPRSTELDAMLFLPFEVRGVVYTAGQQKTALEEYIRRDPYLSAHRGQYAARNGSRTPFAHTIDLKLLQDIRLRMRSHTVHLQLGAELLNLGNLLFKNGGLRYVQPNDQLVLVDFAGYTGNGLLPQYHFDPGKQPGERQFSESHHPAYGSFWTCQFSLRITCK